MARATITALVGAIAALGILSFVAQPASAGATQWGDLDCSGSVTPVDSLKTLRKDAGLSVGQQPGCRLPGATITIGGSPRTWGDVDCANGINPVDSLKLLRFDAGLLSVSAIAGAACPGLGSLFAIDTPVPTPTTAGVTATPAPSQAPPATPFFPTAPPATAAPTITTGTPSPTGTATPPVTSITPGPTSGSQVQASNFHWYLPDLGDPVFCALSLPVPPNSPETGLCITFDLELTPGTYSFMYSIYWDDLLVFTSDPSLIDLAPGTWHLQLAQGALPAGEYRIDLIIGGVAVGSSSVSVDPYGTETPIPPPASPTPTPTATPTLTPTPTPTLTPTPTPSATATPTAPPATPTSTPSPTPIPTLPPPPPSTYLLAQDGTYLGEFTCNTFSLNGIFNKFGLYGNEFGIYSIWNEFGLYGSPFGLYSPFNDFSISPPAITDGVTIYGYLTVNSFVIGAVHPQAVVNTCFFFGSLDWQYWTDQVAEVT